MAVVSVGTSIAAKAEFENLYDRPYEDKKKVRVAGPFTVESLSPHRVLAVNHDDELIESCGENDTEGRDARNFAQVILDNLKTSGVQQAHKEDKITFSSLSPWPGQFICAEGRFTETDNTEKRAGILIGPEFGTLSREDLVRAAREAGDAGFDVLIACAFSYDAHSADFSQLGRIRVLKARMNADLHMAADLKNTGKGNPRCGATTSGPQEDPPKALNIGVAAHITAASPGGARYDESLTSEQRRDARNGIWLCQNCAKLVDNDEIGFPVEYLRAWKTMREFEARMNIGQTTPLRVESESQRKAREIGKWVGKQVMYVIPPVGPMEFVPHPVKLLDANGFFALIRGEGWNDSKSIPMENLNIGWNERLSCIELRERRR